MPTLGINEETLSAGTSDHQSFTLARMITQGVLGSHGNTFFVGYHDDAFADDFEITDNGRTQGGNGQGKWMRDMPTGMGGFDPSKAWTGVKVWGNDLGLSGAHGNYKPFVDTYLESASIDCTGRTGLFLRCAGGSP